MNTNNSTNATTQQSEPLHKQKESPQRNDASSRPKVVNRVGFTFIFSLLIPACNMILFLLLLTEFGKSIYRDMDQSSYYTAVVISLLFDMTGMILATIAIKKQNNSNAYISLFMNMGIFVAKLPAFIPVLLSALLTALLNKF